MFSGPMPMAEFRNEHWNKAFGGDPLRDLAPGLDRSRIDVIVSGELRRKKPYCPTTVTGTCSEPVSCRAASSQTSWVTCPPVRS